MTHNITVQDAPAQRLAAINTRTKMPDIGETMRSAYDELYAVLAGEGIPPNGPPTAVYREFDNQGGVIVEVCVPVTDRVTPTGRIVSDELKASTIVTTLHRGRYEDLPKAYEALQVYMEKHRLAPAGPMRERYLSGPPDTEPEEYETRIEWPIRPTV